MKQPMKAVPIRMFMAKCRAMPNQMPVYKSPMTIRRRSNTSNATSCLSAVRNFEMISRFLEFFQLRLSNEEFVRFTEAPVSRMKVAVCIALIFKPHVI